MQRGKHRFDEQGFTIVEILFATVILFFLLTALLTTLNVSMTMSNKARYGSVASNLAAQQLEIARTLGYSSMGIVGAPSGEPSGTLVANETTIAENITFTITRDVDWVDDPADGTDPADAAPEDYKRLTVTVLWNSPVSVGQLSMATNFREPDEQGIPPNVEFAGDVPVAGAIIHNPSAPYSAGANDGQAAVIHGTSTEARWQATADDSADPSGGIASLTFFFDGLAMVDSFGETCSWAPVGKVPVFTRPSGLGFTINSLASTGTTQYYPDGRHQIRVEAWDDSGMRDFRERLIYVDNFAPNNLSSVSVAAGSGNETRYNQAVVWWPAAVDGNMNAASYEVYRNPITGVGGYVYKQRVSGTSVTTSTLYNDDIQFGSPPFPNGSVRVWYFGANAVSMSGWPSGITYSTYMVNSPGMAGRSVYTSGNGSNRRYRLYTQWGDRSWNTGYDTLMKYDLAMSSAASTGSPPNLFTRPGGPTEIISDVATSDLVGGVVVYTGSSTTTWTVTWDSTSSAANPHFDWKSTQDLKASDAAAAMLTYVQLKARITGSPVSGTQTVYSNVLGPIDLSSAGSTYANVTGGRVFDPPAYPNF